MPADSLQKQFGSPGKPPPLPPCLPQRAEAVIDADARPAQELVQACKRLEDAGVLLLVGLVGVAAVAGALTEIARRADAVDLGKDQHQPAQGILDVEMQDIADQGLGGHPMLGAEL